MPDILDAIQELGGIASPSQSRFADKGDFDGFSESVTGPARLLIRREGGLMPDQLLNALTDPEISTGQTFRLDSTSDLWDAIARAVAEREGDRKAAAREELDEQFREAALTNKPRQAGCEQPVSTSTLKVGDTFKVKRDTCKVKHLDPDSFEVAVECSPRFGRQNLPDNTPLFPDNCQVQSSNPMKRRNPAGSFSIGQAVFVRSQKNWPGIIVGTAGVHPASGLRVFLVVDKAGYVSRQGENVIEDAESFIARHPEYKAWIAGELGLVRARMEARARRKNPAGEDYPLRSKIFSDPVWQSVLEAKKELKDIEKSYQPESGFFESRHGTAKLGLSNHFSLLDLFADKLLREFYHDKAGGMLSRLLQGEPVTEAQRNAVRIYRSSLIDLGYEQDGRTWRRGARQNPAGFFDAPETVEEQKGRIAREKLQREQREELSRRAAARLIGRSVDTTGELFDPTAGDAPLFAVKRKNPASPMNYITRLQRENASLKASLESIETDLVNMIGFLHGPKFQGIDSSGGRKDWISTGDVLRWLQDLRSAAYSRPNPAGRLKLATTTATRRQLNQWANRNGYSMSRLRLR